MTVDSTKNLISKYDGNNNVPGERRTPGAERQHKQRQSRSEKHALADDLIHETMEMLNLTVNDIEHVHYLIDKFPDFNSLHRKAKKETIILAFIWYTYKIRNPKRQLSEFRFTRKYGLSENVFQLILCRVISQLLAESPIIPRKTVKYDNEILSKTGARR